MYAVEAVIIMDPKLRQKCSLIDGQIHFLSCTIINRHKPSYGALVAVSLPGTRLQQGKAPPSPALARRTEK